MSFAAKLWPSFRTGVFPRELARHWMNRRVLIMDLSDASKRMGAPRLTASSGKTFCGRFRASASTTSATSLNSNSGRNRWRGNIFPGWYVARNADADAENFQARQRTTTPTLLLVRVRVPSWRRETRERHAWMTNSWAGSLRSMKPPCTGWSVTRTRSRSHDRGVARADRSPTKDRSNATCLRPDARPGRDTRSSVLPISPAVRAADS